MFAIDHWDWIRIALGLALIGCNIGVWRGVALEESHDRFDKEIGKTLLIRSLALEAFFAAALFVVDTIAGIGQKIEITQLEASNLQLEIQIQPRRLAAADIAALKAAVKPFPNRQISVWSYGVDIEGRLLASQILSALNDAHVPIVDSIGHMVSSTTARIGVIITGPDDELVGALLAALKPLSPTKGSLNNPGSYSKSGIDMLYGGPNIVPAEIFVGIKPIKE
jgi:hypothetical protein